MCPHTPQVYIRFVALPSYKSVLNDFIRFSDDSHPSVPKGQMPMRVLVLGGRDPYKNDLLKWLVGLHPQKSFRSSHFEKPHVFTSLVASRYPDDWRSYRLAMRLGKVDAC